MHHLSFRFLLPASMLLCVAALADVGAQPCAGGAPSTPCAGASVQQEWQTIARPAYGATFNYAWDDIRVRRGGAAAPFELGLHLDNAEVGYFELTSAPITVPLSGMALSFTRTIEMHPSDAERGTTLVPGKDGSNAHEGRTRAVVMQSIEVVDAVTRTVLASKLDWFHRNVTRFSRLEDISDVREVTVDLTPFAGRQVAVRARMVDGYNGRGCSREIRRTLTAIPAAPPSAPQDVTLQ